MNFIDMKRDIIWITGPAATGKTFVINQLINYFLNNIILTDATEMLYLNKIDDSHSHHIHPGNNEGFLLTSSYHFDESVKRIYRKLLNKSNTSTVLVELARGMGDFVHIDLSYRRFISLLPKQIFNRSIILYVRTNWEKRLVRNLERGKLAFPQKVESQSFHVPIEAMEGFFKKDDFDVVKDSISCPIYILNNESNTKIDLKEKIKDIALTIKHKYG